MYLHLLILYLVHVGVALYLEGVGPVQNNSIIRASISGRFNQLQCISGSTAANVGRWIAPNGEDITGILTDSFNVVTGDNTDPGFIFIELQLGHSLENEDHGIYTCIIPDETGDIQYLYVGIYQQGFNSKEINSCIQHDNQKHRGNRKRTTLS